MSPCAGPSSLNRRSGMAFAFKSRIFQAHNVVARSLAQLNAMPNAGSVGALLAKHRLSLTPCDIPPCLAGPSSAKFIPSLVPLETDLLVSFHLPLVASCPSCDFHRKWTTIASKSGQAVAPPPGYLQRWFANSRQARYPAQTARLAVNVSVLWPDDVRAERDYGSAKSAHAREGETLRPGVGDISGCDGDEQKLRSLCLLFPPAVVDFGGDQARRKSREQGFEQAQALPTGRLSQPQRSGHAGLKLSTLAGGTAEKGSARPG
jgi:hypothetical protein